MSPPPSPVTPLSFPSLLNVTNAQCRSAGDCVKCKIYVREKYTFVTNGKENYKQTGIGFEVVLGKFWLAIVNPVQPTAKSASPHPFVCSAS